MWQRQRVCDCLHVFGTCSRSGKNFSPIIMKLSNFVSTVSIDSSLLIQKLNVHVLKGKILFLPSDGTLVFLMYVF